MKVAFVPRYGPPEVVEFRDVPDPAPKAGQVRVKVLATTVSAGDMRIRSGKLPRGFGVLRGLALGFGGPRNAVLGTEAAGVVDAVGEGVTRFKAGDAVVVFPGGAMGAHAEFVLMPADGRIAPKPANLTFEEAVTLPFGGMTMIDFLDRAALKPGEKVLVNGASGNVGTAAVQLAKQRGAHVTAVCSAKNADLVRSLGADDVIDYAQVDFAASGRAWDVIVDTVGNAPYAHVKPVLAPGGRLLAVLAELPAMLGAAFVGGPQKHKVVAGPVAEKPAYLHALVDLAAKGAFKPVIDRVVPFARISEAHALAESGRKVGSVVVSLDVRSAGKA